MISPNQVQEQLNLIVAKLIGRTYSRRHAQEAKVAVWSHLHSLQRTGTIPPELDITVQLDLDPCSMSVRFSFSEGLQKWLSETATTKLLFDPDF